MAIIATRPIRDANIVISGTPPRCRKIDRKHVHVGEFPATMTDDEIRTMCLEKLTECRKGWKSVLNCHMSISPGSIETHQYDDKPPYDIKTVMLFDPKEIRGTLAI
jgi:hypothetical protein